MAQQRAEILLMLFFQLNLNDKYETQTILTDLDRK